MKNPSEIIKNSFDSIPSALTLPWHIILNNLVLEDNGTKTITLYYQDNYAGLHIAVFWSHDIYNRLQPITKQLAMFDIDISVSNPNNMLALMLQIIYFLYQTWSLLFFYVSLPSDGNLWDFLWYQYTNIT